MTTGAQVRKSIEASLSRVRSDETRLTRESSAATDRVAELRSREASAYASLARFRLDAMAGGEVGRELDKVERQALDLLDKRRADYAATSRRIDEIEAELAAASEARDRGAAALDASKAAVGARFDESMAALWPTPEWEEASLALETARHHADASERKAEEAEREKERKRAPFDQDKVFVYLWTRGFGGKAYAGGRFARLGDSWMARLIGYDELRQNYQMLTELPGRLSGHAQRQRAAADSALEALTAMERARLEADGIVALEAALSDRRKEMAKLESAVAECERALGSATDRLESIAGGDDPEFKRALALLAQAAQREDLQSLYREAARTHSDEDDRIVAEIGELRSALPRSERLAEDARAAVREVRDRREQLEEALSAYKRSGYRDNDGSFDNGAMIGATIETIMRGGGRASDLDRMMRNGYRAPPPPRPRVTHSSGSGTGSGSFGGGSFSSGGSFGGGSGGGGGFKTGGSF